MLGGLGGFIASEVGGAVRRNVAIYGLYGFAALLFLAAAGFALGALHTVLALHYDSVSASLIIAGGLFVLALLIFAIAAYIRSRPRQARPIAATALAAAPLAATLLSSRKGWRIGLASALVVLGAVLGRQIFKGSGESDEEA